MAFPYVFRSYHVRVLDQLSITTTYLYKLCRKHLQLFPKEVLDRQTVTEIKTYLVNTDATIKGIADELHFNDVSYMCRFFRRMTGMSPIDYRRSFKWLWSMERKSVIIAVALLILCAASICAKWDRARIVLWPRSGSGQTPTRSLVRINRQFTTDKLIV